MTARTIRHRTHAWQWIAALFMLWALSAGTAAASVQEIQVVGVGVDSSSLRAEQKAIDYAKKRAVYLAARKLNVKDASKLVSQFTAADYKDIVRGHNVTKSKRVGETSYLDVSVTIVDEMLRRALKLPPAPEIDPALLKMRGVMLLTMTIGKERSYLWEKENILRGPVADEVRRQSRGGVLLPGGDLQDLRLIDYQNALTVEPDELKPMFERYGAEEIVIAAVKLGEPGTTDATNIVLRRLEASNTRNEVIEIPPDSVEETTEVRLGKAAVAVAGAVTQIASATAEREREMRDKAQKIKVRFSYAIPKELAVMQEAVRASPEVMHLDMPSIALARVSGTIYLKGSEEALREALVKQGIIVTAINDGWRLSVR